MTALLIIVSILVFAAAAWFFRQRLRRYLPTKQTMLTITLITSIVVLAVLAVLPDLIIVLSALRALSPLLKTALVLAATVPLIVVGCSKPADTPKPAPTVIHWKGQDGGYEDTTTLPPDKPATQ